MGGFFNPFRAPESRDRRPRRCPRYAIESLEARLSPSDFGLSTVDVGSMSMDFSTSTVDDTSAYSDSSLYSDSTSLDSNDTTSTMDDGTSSSDSDLYPDSTSLGSNDTSFDTEPPPPDGDGTPPYTPPGSDGGPAGPA